MSGAPATTAARRAPRSARLRSRLLVAVLVALLLAVVVVAALLGVRSGGRALDPDNPAPGGARALAQLLDAGGVPVQRASRAADAQEALAAGGPGSTLVVTDPGLLDPALMTQLAGGADAVVLLGADQGSLEALGVDLALRGAGSDPLVAAVSPVASGGSPGGGVVAAGCDDPDAAAAGSVDLTEGSGPAALGTGALRATGGGGQVCFDGAYGVGTAASGAQVRVLAAPELASNALLDTAGNAALALRAAGGQPRVVWLVTSPFDVAPDAAPSPVQLLPAWVVPVGLQLALLGAAAVLWRARRFGALVVEPLPVVVRSVETARGRAALYRASRDRASAARSLRAAVRWRLQARLGLPPGTAPAVLAAGAAHATSTTGGPRWSPSAVEHLLAGPVPADDTALATLLRDLDALEAALSGPASSAPSSPADPGRARPSVPATPTPEEHP